MIGILNTMIRSATRMEDFDPTPRVRNGREPVDDRRNGRADRETLFRSRGWGK